MINVIKFVIGKVILRNIIGFIAERSHLNVDYLVTFGWNFINRFVFVVEIGNSCDKSYATSGSLKSHEKCSHSTDRPFKCENCEKTFSNLTNYKNHMRIHTGD